MIKYQCTVNENLNLTININGTPRLLKQVKASTPVILSMTEIAAFQRNFGKDSLTILGAKEV